MKHLKATLEESTRLPVLLTPGPLTIPYITRNAMSFDLGSRGPSFKKITADVRRILTRLASCDDTHSAVLLPGSGSFAIEAALGSFLSDRHKILVLVNGIYGERVCKMLDWMQKPFVSHMFPCDAPIDVTVVRHLLASDPDITHLFFVHCETTTGVLNSYADLAQLANETGVELIVDAMSSFGGTPIDLSESPTLCLISSANKCVEAPPGISFCLVRKNALFEMSSHSKSFSLDVIEQWRAFEAHGEWRSTPPTHVLQALYQALMLLESETIAGRAARHTKAMNEIATEMRVLGFESVLPTGTPVCSCVALKIPAWMRTAQCQFSDYYTYLLRSGIEIYAKVHPETSSFRIGCLGEISAASLNDLFEKTRQFKAQHTREYASDLVRVPHKAKEQL